tara:strand:+ start:456 stop:659 length:204 start_codon:yes stop_codon:yes gene_type:complete
VFRVFIALDNANDILKIISFCKKLTIERDVFWQFVFEPLWSKELVAVSGEEIFTIPVTSNSVKFFGH